MSTDRERTGLIQVQIADEETKERWRDLEEQVASTLGVSVDDLSRREVVREAAEAYIGRDPLGAWRED